jgi:hypothetical protein
MTSKSEQIAICSALLEYYHSSCTNHAIYILSVLLAMAGFMQLKPSPLLEGLLISTSIAIEIRFIIRFFWWAYLASEVAHFGNDGENDFSSLHNKFVKAVRNRAKSEKVVWTVYHLRSDKFQLPLLGVIGSLIFFYTLSKYGVIGSIALDEFSSVNLALGIIGTITGIVALFISWWTLRKEKPHLEVSVLSCEHMSVISQSKVKNVSFWIRFQLKNTGDRGTTINSVDLIFNDDSKKGRYKLQSWSLNGVILQQDKTWLNAHETADVETNFVAIPFPDADKELMNCTFTIYHTHGAKPIECVSHERKET